MMRLHLRLLLGYFAVIAILVVSGALIVERAREDLTETVARDAETLCGSLMEEADLAIQDRVAALRAFAGTSTELHEAIDASNSAFAAIGSDAQIRAAIDADDAAWRDAPAEQPTERLRTLLANPTSQLLRRTMDYYAYAHGRQVFGEIFVTNRFGANAAQTGLTSDYRQDDEGWWQAAWRDGLWVSPDVSFDDSASVHSIDIGVRIDDKNARPLGVLKAVLDISAVRDIVDSFGRRNRLGGAFIEVVDTDGRLIHRQNEPTSFGEDLSGEAAVGALARGEEGTLVETTGRGEMLRAFAASHATHATEQAKSTGWWFILNQPTATVFARLHDLRNWTIWVSVVGSLAAAMVGVMVSIAFARMAQSQRDTSDALRVSEAQVRSIVDNVVDGIITSDSHGTIESVNPAAELIFGRSADEMVGRNLTLLMPEPYHSEHDGYLRRYRETGEARIIGTGREVEGLRKDGTVFPLDLAVSEIHESGRRRYVGIVRDDSERREARLALEEAKLAAEAANSSKSQFLANMSHELRTPLNAVIGYSEMVAEELSDRGETELLPDLAKIRSAGFHLLGLINDILDLSKIEAGRVEVYAETFDLNAAIEDVVATVRPLTVKNDNDFVVDVPAGLGQRHADVTKLRQILLNLLSNASKFARSGRVVLTVRIEPSQPVDWLVLRVSDSGIGMTPEQLARVWDAFAQADASTTREYGGTGLGLPITRRFVELLGGTIETQSTHGEGTTFTVRLPAPAGSAPPASRSTADAAPAALEPHIDTVLVIDDDPAARELVRRFLTREGLTVVEADSGEEGLRLAHLQTPTAIILDVMMPGMDGWAVLAGLRANEALSNVPVIMLTTAEQRHVGLALGVDAYLAKPADREALARALTPFRLNRGERTILLVEDDEQAREIVGRQLRGDGWQVAEAENGHAALAELERHPADLILLDLMMPEMDGFQFVQAIQADERFRDIPVIVLTAKEITREDATRLRGSVEEIVRKSSRTSDELLVDVARLVRRAVARRSRGGSA